jgi:hypothetical protein
MSQTTNQLIPWEDNEPWRDEEQEWGGEDEEEMRLGGTLGGMSFWDALVIELERQRCGRA